MKSILENRPALKAGIDKVAQIAGYLWLRSWTERNGGNITINVTEHGVCAVGPDIFEAFDRVDVLSKSALIYIAARMNGLKEAFKL